MIKKSVRILIVLVAVAAVAGGGFALVKQKKQTLAQAPKYGMRPTPVRVASARLGDLRETRDYLAVVEPIRSANVSARLTANVDKVSADENVPAKVGDILVVLDGRQIEESLGAMKAQIAQAQADLKSNEATVESLAKSAAYWEREAGRDHTLAGKGAIPGAQAEGTADKADEVKGKLEAAKQKSLAVGHLVESLKRRYSELETQLSYCTICSPFDGLVSRRMVDPGDMAVPGKTLIVIEDRSSLKLSFDVPQQDLPQVREGLGVVYPLAEKKQTAALSHLFPSLNAARMLRAEVYLDGADAVGLSSGAYVPLQVVLGNSRNVTLVPASSLVESPDQNPYVFIVRDGHLAARSVSVLGSSGDEMAVEGVQAGEQVVLSTFLGWAQLASGRKVEVMK
jgi:RND family efflux transporter MFP subunit